MVENLDNTSARHLILCSFEPAEDPNRDITVFSYQCCEFKLYKTATSVMEGLYSHSALDLLDAVKKMATFSE